MNIENQEIVEEVVTGQETLTEEAVNTPEVPAEPEQPIEINDPTGLDVEEDNEVDLAQDIRSTINEALDERARLEKAAKENKDIDLSEKIQKLTDKIEMQEQQARYVHFAQKSIKESTEIANNYLDGVDNEIAKLKLDEESYEMHSLKTRSQDVLVSLALQARVKSGREFVTPAEMKQIKKDHWSLMKPEIERVMGRSTIAKPAVAPTNDMSGVTTSQVVKPGEFEKFADQYSQKQKDGTLAAADVFAFQKMINDRKRK